MENKDPAFLFYPSAFLTGTMLFDDDEVGKYIRALCYQHQHGHITEEKLQKVCNGNANVMEKFIKDSDGKYYNERLEEEVEKRKKHAEKQRENAFKRWNKQCDGITNAMPLKDVNKNTNINIYEFIEKEFERTLSSNEILIIDSWIEKFNEEIFKYAIEISVDKGKRTMAYVEGILKNWQGCNYKTLEECKQDKPIKKDNKPLPQDILETINGDYNWLEDNEEE